jgi:hypothetical protein
MRTDSGLEIYFIDHLILNGKDDTCFLTPHLCLAFGVDWFG